MAFFMVFLCFGFVPGCSSPSAFVSLCIFFHCLFFHVCVWFSCFFLFFRVVFFCCFGCFSYILHQCMFSKNKSPVPQLSRSTLRCVTTFIPQIGRSWKVFPQDFDNSLPRIPCHMNPPWWLIAIATHMNRHVSPLNSSFLLGKSSFFRVTLFPKVKSH